MNVYALSEIQILGFSLVLLRMMGFVFSAAVFSNSAVNVTVRVLFSLVFAMSLYPTVQWESGVAEGFSELMPFLAIREVAIGLILGFLTRIFFFSVSMTGDLVSVAVGLNAAQLYNPMMQSQGGVLEQFHVILGSLFFLILNGHHILITALSESFKIVHPGLMTFRTGGLGEMALFGQDLLILTIKMGAPVMVAILLTNMAMGILGRAIPQLNVLVTSFPVTILLGLGTVFICLPLFVVEMNGLVDLTAHKMMVVLNSL